MTEPTDPLFDAITAKLEADRKFESERLATMFTQPAVCLVCGAQVVFPEQHKAFHDAVTTGMLQLRDDIVRVARAAGVLPDPQPDRPNGDNHA